MKFCRIWVFFQKNYINAKNYNYFYQFCTYQLVIQFKLQSSMFNKILGKKKKTAVDAFQIPVKTFTYDSKIISKLTKEEIINIASEQEKYIGNLIKKMESVKDEYMSGVQKCDELTQKNQIINRELKKMANEHQELQIKFTNLESSLEITLKTRENDFKNQHSFLQKTGLINMQKIKAIKNLDNVFQFYRDQVELCKKIEAQNKRLKEMYGNLQMQIFEMSDKLKSDELNLKEVRENKTDFEENNHSHNEDLLDANQELLQKLRLKKEAIDELTKLNKEEMNEINALRQKLGRENQEYQNEKENKYNHLVLVQAQDRNQSYFEVQTDDMDIRTVEIIKEVQAKVTNQQIFQSQEYKKIKEELLKVLSETKQSKLSNEGLEAQLSKTKQEIEIKDKLIQTFEVELSILKQSVQSLKNENRRQQNRFQEKQTLIEQYKNNLQTYKQLDKKFEEMEKQIEKEKQQKFQKMEVIKSLQKKVSELQISQKQNNQTSYLLQQRITKYQSQITELNSRIQIYSEDLKCKQRKHESDINQERIKSENMKRTITVLEGKNQELNASMENIYKEILDKNILISQMQEKLRQYKKRIQQLRKDKRRITEQFEHKIKINQELNQKKEGNPHIEQEKEVDRKSSKSEGRNGNGNGNCQIDRLENQEERLRQSVNILTDKNKVLLGEIEQLKYAVLQAQAKCEQKQKIIKQLNEKREHSMRQIQRLSVLSKTLPNGFSRETKENSNFSESTSELTTPRNISQMSREKKIADKAFRGFDILMKLNQQLYKEFVIAFANQIRNQKISNLQKAINILVNKSSDMKDIFEDYL